jgi:hypothetical protein
VADFEPQARHNKQGHCQKKKRGRRWLNLHAGQFSISGNLAGPSKAKSEKCGGHRPPLQQTWRKAEKTGQKRKIGE